MFAFISFTEDDPEDEGVIGWKFGDTWIPLVGADMARIDSLRPVAKKIAEISGKKIVLSKFSKREDLEEIQ